MLGTDTQLRCDIPNIRVSLRTDEHANHHTDLSFFVVVGWMTFGMWYSIIWWISSNILQESIATVFRLEVEMEAIDSFKMYPFTRPYNINHCCLMYCTSSLYVVQNLTWRPAILTDTFWWIAWGRCHNTATCSYILLNFCS